MISFSQSITIGSDTAIVGENILIPLSTNGLLNVGSMDIKITYDSTVLIFVKDTLQSTDAAGSLLNVTAGNGTYKQINISWLAPGSAGVNISNGNFMFFKFNYIGGNTSLNFNQLLCEVSDWNGNPITITYNAGSIVPSAGSNASIWNGNSNWSNVANWNNGIPGVATSAIINSGNLEINNVAECNNLSITTGSIVTILPNKSLTVFGNFENKGSIIIKSDSSGSGSFINYGIITGNGNIIVEKYLAKSNPADYSLVCSPVTNATISSTVFSNTTFQSFNEPTQTWQNLAANSILQSGKGYLINCNSNKKIEFSDTVIANGNIGFNNLTFSNNAGTNIPNGFNLVGNPYTSAVDWNNTNWTKTNIDASIYTFDGVNYVSWNGEIGSLTDGIIPSLQGFFVKANANNPVLVMPDTARLHNSQPFYKSSPNSLNELLIVKATGNNYNDVAYINFNSNASAQFDTEYDAYKLFGISDAPQIYTILPSNNTNLSINVMDSVKPGLSVPIGFKAGVAGVYSLSFNNQSSFAPAINMYLEDTKTNTITNLRNTPDYSFTSTPGDNPNRFVLDFFNPTAIDENSTVNVNIYSFNKQLVVQFDKNAENSKMIVYNLLGQVVKELVLNGSTTFTVNVSDLQGNYIIQVINKSNVSSKKINI